MVFTNNEKGFHMIDNPNSTLEPHPIANVWPMLSKEELQELADNIQQLGLLQPVVLYEGKILDGRNRARACELAGVDIKTTKYEGDDPIGYALALNEKRRHLTSSQRAALAVELKPLYAAEAKKRQRAAGGNHNPSGKNQHAKEGVRSLVQNFSQATKSNAKKPREKSRSLAAQACQTNQTYVSQAEKIKAESPALFTQLKEGKLNIPQAKKILRSESQQDWSDTELERKEKVLRGEAVLANETADFNLIQWAEKEKLTIRIDRRSWWENPFILQEDGSRDEVCDLFEKTYLPNKKSFIKSLKKLRGKVLICHCYPKRCHGEALLRRLDAV